MKKPSQEEVKKDARELADKIAGFLRQEYKKVNGQWWLFSLGKPRRPLTPDEVEYAKGRGLIKEE